MDRLLGEKLKFDWKIAGITIVSTLLFSLDYYHDFTGYKYWDGVLLFLLVPLFVILVFYRESPQVYGFSFGDWKTGLALTVIGIGLMTPVIWYLGSRNEAMRSYYAFSASGLPWTTFLDLIGWEFILRGWILFGYARRFGPNALWLQAVPFALLHNGKPEVETLSTIFGGFVFGWIAYRTKSFIWPFLIHWFIATLIIMVAAGMV